MAEVSEHKRKMRARGRRALDKRAAEAGVFGLEPRWKTLRRKKPLASASDLLRCHVCNHVRILREGDPPGWTVAGKPCCSLECMTQALDRALRRSNPFKEASHG